MNANNLETSLTGTASPGHNASLTTFTCNICQEFFADSAGQRAHFKSDLHIRRLRQRNDEHPAAVDRFRGHSSFDRVSQPNRANNEDRSERLKPGKPKVTILSVTEPVSYDLEPSSASEPHRYAPKHTNERDVGRIEGNEPSSATAVTEQLSFVPSRCIMCDQLSVDLDNNLLHMDTVHGLMVPRTHKLIDIETFVRYLHTIVIELNECLDCGIAKGSVNGVRQHMLTKGHFKLGNTSTDIQSEYLGFYEESSVDSDESASSSTADDTDEVSAQEESHAATNQALQFIDAEQYEVRLDSGRTVRRRPHKISSQTAIPRTSRAKIYRHEEESKLSSRVSGIKSQTSVNEPSRSTENHEPEPAVAESSNTLLSVQASTSNDSAHPQSKALSFRPRKSEEQGLIGVSEWQRRALIAQQKSITRSVAQKSSHFKAGLQKTHDRERKDVKRARRRKQRVPESI